MVISGHVLAVVLTIANMLYASPWGYDGSVLGQYKRVDMFVI